MSYLRNRFYVRGTTCLGLINTVLGAVFNRVWVQIIDSETGPCGGFWDRGTDHPPIRVDMCRICGLLTVEMCGACEECYTKECEESEDPNAE